MVAVVCITWVIPIVLTMIGNREHVKKVDKSTHDLERLRAVIQERKHLRRKPGLLMFNV